MSSPSYSPDQIYALARVLAAAALDELINEITKTNAASPDQEKCGVLGAFDDGDDTPVQTA